MPPQQAFRCAALAPAAAPRKEVRPRGRARLVPRPPLVPHADVEQLWRYVQDGRAPQQVHAAQVADRPHELAPGHAGIPFGQFCNGVQLARAGAAAADIPEQAQPLQRGPARAEPRPARAVPPGNAAVPYRRGARRGRRAAAAVAQAGAHDMGRARRCPAVVGPLARSAAGLRVPRDDLAHLLAGQRRDGHVRRAGHAPVRPAVDGHEPDPARVGNLALDAGMLQAVALVDDYDRVLAAARSPHVDMVDQRPDRVGPVRVEDPAPEPLVAGGLQRQPRLSRAGIARDPHVHDPVAEQ